MIVQLGEHTRIGLRIERPALRVDEAPDEFPISLRAGELEPPGAR